MQGCYWAQVEEAQTNFGEMPSWGPIDTPGLVYNSRTLNPTSSLPCARSQFSDHSHREFDAAVAKQHSKWRFASSQTLFAVALFSVIRRFSFAFDAHVVLIYTYFFFTSLTRCCCSISFCAFLWCSSTLRIPPLGARRSSRSTTIRNCILFTFFCLLLFNLSLFLLCSRNMFNWVCLTPFILGCTKLFLEVFEFLVLLFS